MSNTATLPMSLASVGYALFALQQSVPTESLQPITFKVNAPIVPGGMQPNIPAPASGGGSMFTPSTPAAAPAAAASPTERPMGPVHVPAAFNPAAALAAATPAGVGGTAVIDPGAEAPAATEPAAAPAAPAADGPDLTGIYVPKTDVEIKEANQGPRAAVQIGLLRELSFLDG